MILYTMMPQELIFPAELESANQQQLVSYQGVTLLVEQTDQQNVQVVRIMSSDPQHFLDQRICPGSKISYADLQGISAF
nr:YlzJ-like family protein [Neobacillus sp. Marseille-Q6967]